MKPLFVHLINGFSNLKKILTIFILVIVLPTNGGWSLWNFLYTNRVEEGLVKVNVRNFIGIENLELTEIEYSVQELSREYGMSVSTG